MKIVFSFFFLLFEGLVAQEVKLVVLGTAQDAGAPQIACKKECCKSLWESGQSEAVVALGLIDSTNQKHYLLKIRQVLRNNYKT